MSATVLPNTNKNIKLAALTDGKLTLIDITGWFIIVDEESFSRDTHVKKMTPITPFSSAGDYNMDSNNDFIVVVDTSHKNKKKWLWDTIPTSCESGEFNFGVKDMKNKLFYLELKYYAKQSGKNLNEIAHATKALSKDKKTSLQAALHELV